jgi:hypothetical protein
MQSIKAFFSGIALGLLLIGSLVWAADTSIFNFTAFTSLASGDLFAAVDVSDTTQSANGSTRKITAANMATFFWTAPSFTAGSASAGTWPKWNSGTVMTTAEVGAVEMDAHAFYATTDAGNRGVVEVQHCIRQDASRTLPNDTNENAIFNSVTNGRITLETGTYFFKGMIYVTGMSATSGNALIDVLGAGTATAGTWLWQAWGIDNSTLTNAGTKTGAFTITQQSVASIVTAGTGTGMAVQIEGTVEITGAGTMIPSIDQVTAAAATLAAGSYFCINRIGSTSMTSVGQWD